MLNIGEFAGMTGLSVKALRHYDDKDVLVPAQIVDATGYRRYREDQVRSGVVVRALRDAGVPLQTVAEAVVEGSAREVLDAHRLHVLAERDREDRAFTHAAGVLSALAAPIEIIRRTVGEQPFVGRVMKIDDALTDDDANEQFAELSDAVQAAGAGPAGSFWTTIRTADEGAAEIVCCWTTSTRLSAEWGGDETVVDTLPPREELAAIWRADGDQDLPEGATHPAVVALFDAIAARGIEMPATELRQRVLGDSEKSYAVEVSITLP